MRDGLVDAEPQNVREIISVQAVCLIFRGQSRWGFLFAVGGFIVQRWSIWLTYVSMLCSEYAYFYIKIKLTRWYKCSENPKRRALR
ncbi:UNVERIFIED_ORG: hypothetical protein BDU10_5735 [Burkholderia sp. CF145]|jgi:hypothetical protein